MNVVVYLFDKPGGLGRSDGMGSTMADITLLRQIAWVCVQVAATRKTSKKDSEGQEKQMINSLGRREEMIHYYGMPYFLHTRIVQKIEVSSEEVLDCQGPVNRALEFLVIPIQNRRQYEVPERNLTTYCLVLKHC